MYPLKNKYLKHLDFIVTDILIVTVSYILACLFYSVTKDAVFIPSSVLFRHELVALFACFLMTNLFNEPYKNILKRDKWMEMRACLKHTIQMAVIEIAILFFVHDLTAVSRLTFIYTWIIYYVLETCFRLFWKRMLRHHILHGRKEAKSSVLLVTRYERVRQVMNALNISQYGSFFISGIFLTDYQEDRDKDTEYDGIKVLGSAAEIGAYTAHHWVDSVIIDVTTYEAFKAISVHFERMGIPTHRVLTILPKKHENNYIEVQKLGKVVVASHMMRDVSVLQRFGKRTMDIVGGIVGCIFTGIIFIFVAPQIYHASPGPIFFAQERIGKNGRRFKMYKFRSMYLDAEERKKELMKQNKRNGLMFKMDDEPRIIGSEKKDKNGKPKGIGNFIRNTSLDEFPQFFNVLKGDMSLVGTRPPTVDEWNQYSEEHRIRMAMRPGITGMWQVSGRSNITDFNEIVRLDEEYIANWTVGLDVRILAKTVTQVLHHDGAE